MIQFFNSKKAVSPVIGTILMVAVTVIMGAIVGGFVYQTARPKTAPTIASTLEDDERVMLSGSDNTSKRIAKLTFEGGKNIAKAELRAIVTFIDASGTAGTTQGTIESTLVLDGAGWVAGTATAMSTNKITLKWVDSDNSGDITPGDRLDFANHGTDLTTGQAWPSTDFIVKLVHKPTEATLSSHTIKVY